MKRRSARPFTVEIKHTRISRDSLSEATANFRTGQDIWRDMPLVVADKSAEVRPAPMVQRESAPPKIPARRVLPSLVPMFSMPVEPETPDVRHAPGVERLPRVRRVKEMNKHEQKSAIKMTASASPVMKPTVQAPVTPAIATPALAETLTETAQPTGAEASTGRRTRQSPILRPGERWKRRLPRVLW
jgi:hypothetical protein